MAKSVSNETEAGSQVDTGALLGRITQLEEQLRLLQFAADGIARAKAHDPMDAQARAEEIVRRSMDDSAWGPNTWIVTIPGFVNPVKFRTHADSEPAAIREFETRFGTRFITNNQREDDNHKIARASA